MLADEGFFSDFPPFLYLWSLDYSICIRFHDGFMTECTSQAHVVQYIQVRLFFLERAQLR